MRSEPTRERLPVMSVKFSVNGMPAEFDGPDGVALRTCVMPVMMADGRQVTTIEGLSHNGDHPVQKAWTELDVPQCGYCQSGMIMAAASLLSRHPDPSDADIDREMTNLCRCATYARIRAAIHRAAKMR